MAEEEAARVTTMDDVERAWNQIEATPLPLDLVVGTMCHCDEPDECDDHWEFFAEPVNYDPATGHLSRGRQLSEAEMRAIAVLVRGLG